MSSPARSTPQQIKRWLQLPARGKTETDVKLSALEYIERLENIVALYTERDGKVKNNGGCIDKTAAGSAACATDGHA